MRPTVDPTHKVLEEILREMVDADVDVTAREVVRRHPLLKSPSDFTRNTTRMKLISDAQKLQDAARLLRTDVMVQKSATLAEQLSAESARVKELEGQVRSLVASHLACVRVVKEVGGMKGLLHFWKTYGAVAEHLQAVGGLAGPADVTGLEFRNRPPSTRPEKKS